MCSQEILWDSGSQNITSKISKNDFHILWDLITYLIKYLLKYLIKSKPLECWSFSNKGGQNHWSVAHLRHGKPKTIGVLLIFKQGKPKPLECCSFYAKSVVLLKRNATFSRREAQPGSSAWLGCRRSQKSLKTLSKTSFSSKTI